MLVRYMSHQIRTPLNTILLGLRFVMKNAIDRSHEEDVEVLEDSISSCQISQQILDNLLTYERFESGKIEMFPRQMVVELLVHNSYSLFDLEVSQHERTTNIYPITYPLSVI